MLPALFHTARISQPRADPDHWAGQVAGSARRGGTRLCHIERRRLHRLSPNSESSTNFRATPPSRVCGRVPGPPVRPHVFTLWTSTQWRLHCVSVRSPLQEPVSQGSDLDEVRCRLRIFLPGSTTLGQFLSNSGHNSPMSTKLRAPYDPFVALLSPVHGSNPPRGSGAMCISRHGGVGDTKALGPFWGAGLWTGLRRATPILAQRWSTSVQI